VPLLFTTDIQSQRTHGFFGPLTAHQENLRSCTAACDCWLQIELRGPGFVAGTPCPYSGIINVRFYAANAHKHPCRESFAAGWSPPAQLPEWMRPEVPTYHAGGNFVLALPAGRNVVSRRGRRPQAEALDWLMKFSSEKKRLRSISWTLRRFLSASGVQAEYLKRISRGDNTWATLNRRLGDRHLSVLPRRLVHTTIYLNCDHRAWTVPRCSRAGSINLRMTNRKSLKPPLKLMRSNPGCAKYEISLSIVIALGSMAIFFEILVS